MMKLVVAEKPSVARDIAAVIGANEIVNGVMRGNGYIVTSARGHLVALKEPEDYDAKYQNWSLDDLPIIPDRFEFVPMKKSEDVLERLTMLMNSDDVDEIICATDAGREGECIFRYIYDYIECKKPVMRLWISSLTPDSIKNGFNSLLPSSDKDSMYSAGITRAKIDWLWGINLSRLYTKHLNATCSVGRVQTAVLNMIVQRDNEIDSFTKKPYFKLRLDNGAEWFDENGDYFTTRTEAENVKAKCENAPCRVVSVKRTDKKENRPLLYSLTSLQVEANEKYGFTASNTLAVMQSLYEKKLLTYPRTDSNYLTDDMAAVLGERVAMLRGFDETVDELLAIGLNIDNRIINNEKVSDHHAIIPTENISRLDKFDLTDEEKAILGMVFTRFLAALSPQHEYTETEYVFDVGGEKFHCKTKVTTNPGWKRYYPETDKAAPLSYSEGDVFTAGDLDIAECETAPPKHFTESTLLKAMENIDRRIEDKELSSYVSERGLGTPATRAGTIENIIQHGYIVRAGKQLVSTEKGKQLIPLLPDEVKSIEMTAAMELQLSAIEKGTVSADEVISGIIAKINAIIEAESGKEHISLAPHKEPIGKCPKCGGNVYKFVKDNNAVYYCENSPKTCYFRLYEDNKFFAYKGKRLTESTMKTLLAKGKVKLTGLISQNKGTTYDATIILHDEEAEGYKRFGFKMEFDNTKPKR